MKGFASTCYVQGIFKVKPGCDFMRCDDYGSCIFPYFSLLDAKKMLPEVQRWFGESFHIRELDVMPGAYILASKTRALDYKGIIEDIRRSFEMLAVTRTPEQQIALERLEKIPFEKLTIDELIEWNSIVFGEIDSNQSQGELYTLNWSKPV